MVWVVFDLDDTLLRNDPVGKTPGTPLSSDDEDVNLVAYHETERVLRYLYDREIPIALASFRTNARDTLAEFGLLSYFQALEFGQDGRSKATMINQLAKKLKLDPYEAIFFDDNDENVELCTNKLIYTVSVHRLQGVTLAMLFNALTALRNRPLYIVTRSNIDEQELRAFFPDFRVFFLTACRGDDRSIALILRETAKHNPLALRIGVKDELSLFVNEQQYVTRSNDLYLGLDELFLQANLNH